MCSVIHSGHKLHVFALQAEVFIAKFEGEHRQVTKLLSEVLKRLRSPEEDSQVIFFNVYFLPEIPNQC